MRIIDYFDNGAKYYPSQTAFVDLDHDVADMSYADAHAASHRIAAAIRGRGYGKGAHIGILAPNSTIAFVTLLGLFRAEGVWLPINPRNPVPVNADLLSRFDGELLFFHSSYAAEAAQIMAEAPNLREAICIDAEGTRIAVARAMVHGLRREARHRAGRRRRPVCDLPDRRHDGQVEGRDDHASQHRDTVREFLRPLPLSRRHAAPGRRADDPHGGYRRRDALRARRHQRHHEQGLAAGRRRRDREAPHHAPVPAADRAVHDAGAAGHPRSAISVRCSTSWSAPRRPRSRSSRKRSRSSGRS